jgi:hypothetical protein
MGIQRDADLTLEHSRSERLLKERRSAHDVPFEDHFLEIREDRRTQPDSVSGWSVRS